MSEELIWIAPNGVQTSLMDEDTFQVLWGVDGRFMPPVDLVEDLIPEESGSVLRQVRFGPREVGLPLDVRATSEQGLRALLRSLLTLFNPTRGDGVLRSIGPAGDIRDLNCRYRAGMELRESQGESGETWQRAMVVFRAFDPFWYDANDIRLDFGTVATPFFPFLPMRLSGSSVISDFSIFNTGDESAWPVWTISGPGSDPVFRNTTTGKSLSLVTTLAVGDVVVIDTRPRRKTIIKNGVTNLYPTLNPAGSLWPIGVGNNDISLTMTGTTAASKIEVAYKRRFLGV